MRVNAILLQQLSVISPLRNTAFIDHNDLVCVPDGGKTVGDGDGCPVLRQLLQAFLNMAFTLIVQSAGGLVKNQNRGILQENPGNGYTLFLTAGKACSPFSHKGIIAVRQRLDELVNIGLLAASMISSSEAPGFP